MADGYSVIDTETLGNREGTTFQTPWGTLVVYLENGEVHINLGQFDNLYLIPSQITITAPNDDTLNPDGIDLDYDVLVVITTIIDEELSRIFTDISKGQVYFRQKVVLELIKILRTDLTFLEVKGSLVSTGVLKLREA